MQNNCDNNDDDYNELTIPLPPGANSTTYVILGNEICKGKLLRIEISVRDGVWLVIELTVNDNETLTVEYCDDDIGRTLFVTEEEAKAALSKSK